MLTPGTRLGVHEITGPLGSGGMGEVYRARDTQLGREVALKMLPAEFATDPDRLARFEREARTLAALNHPHIAQIYGIESAVAVGDTHGRALVMELVEGDDLAARIARGALPLDEALPIARQIAEALEAAHDAGIIHRDLKPANIKVRADGTVKVLDFGLAKPGATASTRTAEALNSPTITSPAALTMGGSILGTAAYMAPEQAKGKSVDQRADIWAFGAVFYEMLSGRRAFGGDDVTDTIVSVMSKEPDWSALPASTPHAIATLLRRALEKNPQKRLPHIGLARFEIDEALAASGGLADSAWREPTASLPAARPRRRVLLAVAAVALVSTGAALGGWWAGRRAALPAAPTYRSTLVVTQSTNINPRPPSNRLAISPDGRQLAMVLADETEPRPRLWLRRLDGLEMRVLTGTEDAVAPFWSPDSRFIAFFADGTLKRIDPASGAISAICEAKGSTQGRMPGTWSRDDVILFANPDTLARVSARGGRPEPITALDAEAGETQHNFPHFLPDGRHFLYVAYKGLAPLVTSVASLDSPARVRLMEGGSNVQYAAGSLVFLRDTGLVAQPFDAAARQLSGQPVTIAEFVLPNLSTIRGGAFTVSQAGTIVYQSAVGFGGARLLWSTRGGEHTTLDSEPTTYFDLSLAPDGVRATISPIDARGRSEIWVLNLARGLRTRATFGGSSVAAVWAPDGRSIVFNSRARGTLDLYRRSLDGGAEELLYADAADKVPLSWSPDGRFLLYDQFQPQTANDIWLLPLDGSGKPVSFLAGPFAERWAQFSPDGRWVAYTSDESGRREVYVTRFPGAVGRWQVSSAGGSFPRWSRNGRELFFHTPDNKIDAAAVDARSDGFDVQSLTPLFDARSPEGFSRYFYDVAPDGRFLIGLHPPGSDAAQLTLLTNWPALLNESR